METKMIRVPFNVELAKRIQNNKCEGRIVTRYGRNARIICFDAKSDDNIVALIEGENCVEFPKSYTSDGIVFLTGESECDLMLEIPEYMTFKDGDILTYRKNENRWSIFVYKNRDSDVLANYVEYDCDSMGNNIIKFERSFYNSKFCKKATEEERQKLIDALKSSKEPKAKECLKKLGIEEKQEFDFKPFDKVLVKDDDENSAWSCNLFSGKNEDGTYMCIGGYWDMCIPYNEQTEQLLGTTENYE